MSRRRCSWRAFAPGDISSTFFSGGAAGAVETIEEEGELPFSEAAREIKRQPRTKKTLKPIPIAAAGRFIKTSSKKGTTEAFNQS
jgi:hypothetical protein